MATRETLFHPDSCACQVTYAWDDAVAPEQIEFTPVSIVPCELHAPTLTSKGLQAAFDEVLAHNRAAAAARASAQQADIAAKE